MKKTLSTLAVCSLLIFIAVLAIELKYGSATTVGANNGGAARLTAVDPEIDLGRLSREQAKDLTVSARLRNESGNAVKIVKVQTSCTCTTAILPGNNIPPGQELAVSVKLKWSDRSGSQASSVFIETDPPSPSPLVIEIRGFVEVPVLLSPGTIDFAEVHSGDIVSRTVEVVCNSKLLDSDVPQISNCPSYISIVKCDTSQDHWSTNGSIGRYDILLRAPKAPQQLKGKIDFAVGNQHLLLPYSADVVGKYRAVPSQLTLGVKGNAELILWSTTTTNEMPKIADEIGLLSFVEEPIDDSGRVGWRVRITAKDGLNAPVFTKTNVIISESTDDQLSVPIIILGSSHVP